MLVSETVGAAEMVTNGENGFSFNPRSIGEMAATLLRFHNLPQEGRQHMSEASLAIAENWAPEKFGDAVSAIMQLLASEGRIQLADSGRAT